jgi:acyl carrier protein
MATPPANSSALFCVATLVTSVAREENEMVDQTTDAPDRIRKFIEQDVLLEEVANLENDTPLLTGMMDSFGLMQLVSFLEEEFGIEIGPQDMTPEQFGNIDQIVTFVRHRSGA